MERSLSKKEDPDEDSLDGDDDTDVVETSVDDAVRRLPSSDGIDCKAVSQLVCLTKLVDKTSMNEVNTTTDGFAIKASLVS